MCFSINYIYKKWRLVIKHGSRCFRGSRRVGISVLVYIVKAKPCETRALVTRYKLLQQISVIRCLISWCLVACGFNITFTFLKEHLLVWYTGTSGTPAWRCTRKSSIVKSAKLFEDFNIIYIYILDTVEYRNVTTHRWFHIIEKKSFLKQINFLYHWVWNNTRHCLLTLYFLIYRITAGGGN